MAANPSRASVPACQDAVAYRNMPRPIFALSDCACSVAVNEFCAQALVTGITRFLISSRKHGIPQFLNSGSSHLVLDIDIIALCTAGGLLLRRLLVPS